MGHRVQSNDLFRGVCYNTKSSQELRVAMTSKVEDLRASCSERDTRIMKLRDEYNISAERLADLIYRFRNEGSSSTSSYNNQGEGPLVPAGVIANIVREREMIDKESGQLQKMELILRNLRDTEPYFNDETGQHIERPCIHHLTDMELEYLGF